MNKALDFTLPDVRGGTVTLSTLLKKGRVALVFYRGGWCPLCNKQLAELTAHYQEFQEEGIEILAVSNEEIKKGQKVLEKIGPPFPLLYDVDSTIIAEYHLVVRKRDPLGLVLRKQKYAFPAVFLIGKNQEIQWVYKGKTYRDRPSSEMILHAVKK